MSDLAKSLIDRAKCKGYIKEPEKPVIEKPKEREISLRGQTITLTGKLNKMNRREAKELISKCGAYFSDTPCATGLLVVGDRPGSKLQKAKQYGTEIIDEDEFLIRAGMKSRHEVMLKNTLNFITSDIDNKLTDWLSELDE